jgi:hypothetical protein
MHYTHYVLNNSKIVYAEFLLLVCATYSNIFISECKFKIPNMPTQNASYTYKIIKIYFKYQNSKS